MNTAILFDADGVLTLPEDMFSLVYARSHGLDSQPFEVFFKTQWTDYVTGKKDLKEHIESNPDLWQWSGSADELLEYWFETENIQNSEMINLIHDIRASGLKCFLATEQEKYRGEYMKNVMFKDLFDGYFITADIGIKKSDPKFFDEILKRLNNDGMELDPTDVVFFDDSQSKVDAALAAGLDAHLFESVETVRQVLAQKHPRL